MDRDEHLIHWPSFHRPTRIIKGMDAITKPIRLLPSALGQRDWSMGNGRTPDEAGVPRESGDLQVPVRRGSARLCFKEACGQQLLETKRLQPSLGGPPLKLLSPEPHASKRTPGTQWGPVPNHWPWLNPRPHKFQDGWNCDHLVVIPYFVCIFSPIVII